MYCSVAIRTSQTQAAPPPHPHIPTTRQQIQSNLLTLHHVQLHAAARKTEINMTLYIPGYIQMTEEIRHIRHLLYHRQDHAGSRVKGTSEMAFRLSGL